MPTYLRIESSARKAGSLTRELADAFYNALPANASVIERDVAKGLPFIDEDWVAANFTDEQDRTTEQRNILALSDELVSELEEADIITIGLPIYNFAAPASLKAWVDLVTRARKTFRYTENGPQGLLNGKRAIIFVASGGTEAESTIDYATPYIRHILGFIGISDVTVIKADQTMVKGEKARDEALEKINLLRTA